MINIWGPDHHGYIPRMKAAMAAFGFDPNRLEVLIAQQINLLKEGKPFKMSKRRGEFITMRDLLEEVGNDAARWYFLMRSPDSHLDFDLELAKKETAENPVFYVQYAHARISSIFRQLDGEFILIRSSSLLWSGKMMKRRFWRKCGLSRGGERRRPGAEPQTDKLPFRSGHTLSFIL